MARDIGAATHLIRGQIVQLEQTALDLMAAHTAALDPVEGVKLADEYEACWELKTQYEEILRRVNRNT